MDIGQVVWLQGYVYVGYAGSYNSCVLGDTVVQIDTLSMCHDAGSINGRLVLAEVTLS